MNRYEQFAVIQKGWSPPRELRHSAPRQVRLSHTGVSLAIVAALLVLGTVAAAVTLGRMSLRETETYQLLESRGKETDARVIRLWRSKGENKRRHVEYRFELDGHTYFKAANVPLAIWKTLEAGGLLPVRYLPSNPDLNHPSAWRQKPMSIWLAVLLPAGLLTLLICVVIALRRQIELSAEGRAAPAVVTRLQKVHHSHGGGVTIIHYEFRLLSGGIAKGKSSSQRKGVTAGTVLSVLYDPNNPRRSALYPLDLVRVNE